MNKKKSLIKIFTLVAVCVFSLTFFRAFFYVPFDEIPLSEALLEKVVAEKYETTVKTETSSYPINLVIPKLEINAKVVQVGITKKGNMATPNNFTDVGWYKYGTIPGEKGSAVIAGHLDNGLSLPGVFYNLRDLKNGDDIYIMTKENERLHFIVTKSEIYDFNASSGNIFTENNGKLLKL